MTWWSLIRADPEKKDSNCWPNNWGMSSYAAGLCLNVQKYASKAARKHVKSYVFSKQALSDVRIPKSFHINVGFSSRKHKRSFNACIYWVLYYSKKKKKWNKILSYCSNWTLYKANQPEGLNQPEEWLKLMLGLDTRECCCRNTSNRSCICTFASAFVCWLSRWPEQQRACSGAHLSESVIASWLQDIWLKCTAKDYYDLFFSENIFSLWKG